MTFTLTKHNIRVMRARLGKASALISNDRYLPMFRNRQKNHPEEFEQSVEQALSGRVKHPSRWFAKVWGVKQLSETIEMMRAYINRAKSRLADIRHQMTEQSRLKRERAMVNPRGLNKLATMRSSIVKSFSIT